MEDGSNAKELLVDVIENPPKLGGGGRGGEGMAEGYSGFRGLGFRVYRGLGCIGVLGV